MKVPRNPLFLGLLLAAPALAAVLNDGTTTNGLVQFSPEVTAADAPPMNLQAGPAGALTVEQGPFFLVGGAAMSSWYAASSVATQVNYTVSADFLGAQPTNTYRGGVVGWLDTQSESREGLAFFVTYEEGPGVTLALVDFQAAQYSGDRLFTLAGEPIGGEAPRLTLNAGHQPALPVTLEIAFSAPTAEDTNAVTNATAHLVAQAWQGAPGSRTAVSDPLELLTDLPLPSTDYHRFGYFALWGSLFGPDAPEVLGSLDNLTAAGSLGVANLPPIVRLDSPASGASFLAPATIPLVATAEDTDGQVVRVEFYAGTNLVATATNSPFTGTWTNVTEGAYDLTAVATDNRGLRSTSVANPVTVTSPAGAPTLTITLSGATVTVSWDRSGYQLESTPELGSGNWTALVTNGNQYSETADGSRKFYRLTGSGAPAGPALTLTATGGTLTLTWDQPGYQLESKSDLNATDWSPVPTNGTQYSESIPAGTGAVKLFRLRKV